jgi:hypothetical protein
MDRVVEMCRPQPMAVRDGTIVVDREVFAGMTKLLVQLIEARPFGQEGNEMLLQTVLRLSLVVFELVCREDPPWQPKMKSGR